MSIFNKTLTPHSGVQFEPVMRIDPEAYSPDPDVNLAMEENVYWKSEWSYCQYEAPENLTYSVGSKWKFRKIFSPAACS